MPRQLAKKVHPNRTKWYLNNELHREDGPTVEWVNGDKSWYLNVEYLIETEFKKRQFPISIQLELWKYSILVSNKGINRDMKYILHNITTNMFWTGTDWSSNIEDSIVFRDYGSAALSLYSSIFDDYIDRQHHSIRIAPRDKRAWFQ